MRFCHAEGGGGGHTFWVGFNMSACSFRQTVRGTLKKRGGARKTFYPVLRGGGERKRFRP